jgi:catalase
MANFNRERIPERQPHAKGGGSFGYGQARTLINKVMNEPQRARLVDNVSGALRTIRRDEILLRAFQYWRNVDEGTGARIEAATLRKRNVAAA